MKNVKNEQNWWHLRLDWQTKVNIKVVFYFCSHKENRCNICNIQQSQPVWWDVKLRKKALNIWKFIFKRIPTQLLLLNCSPSGYARKISLQISPCLTPGGRSLIIIVSRVLIIIINVLIIIINVCWVIFLRVLRVSLLSPQPQSGDTIITIIIVITFCVCHRLSIYECRQLSISSTATHHNVQWTKYFYIFSVNVFGTSMVLGALG